MRRFAWLMFCATGLVVSSPAQIHLNENPTIEYSTPAVLASKAIDDIGRLAEKKIKVADPLSQQPLIMRLHNAPYKDVMKWLATTLNGAWIDKDNYKVLTRSTYINLTLKNVSQRRRAKALSDYVLANQLHTVRNVLTPDSARRTILTLYGTNSDRASEKYKIALKDSADARLLDQAIAGIRPLDFAAVPYPTHAVFSNKPRFLQYAIRMSATEFNKLVAEQNLWTATLKSLATKHPELRKHAVKRLPIESGSRIMLVFSNPVQGIPTHVAGSILGPGGNPRVLAEKNLNIATGYEPSPNDWSAFQIADVSLNSLSKEFLAAASRSESGTNSLELIDALLGPSRFDPLQFVVSDALLNISNAKNWNLVAVAPDATLLDPGIRATKGEGVLDGPQFMRALENTCRIQVDRATMLVTPLEPFVAERKRAKRLPMELYVGSLNRAGYSTTAAEAALADANTAEFDPELVKLYARLLKPSATPFLDTQIEALGFYGSFTVENRKWLNNGMEIPLREFSDAQKLLLGGMLLNAPKRILIDKNVERVFTNRQDPEITNLVDSPVTPNERVTLAARKETVLRAKGVDSFGRHWDQVLTVAEAPTTLRRQGPWRSIEFATADANVIKLTLRASSVADVVHFLREYPDGFSAFGEIASLPLDVRKSMANWTGPVMVR